MTIEDEKLDELERCAEAATEGPWCWECIQEDSPEKANFQHIMAAGSENPSKGDGVFDTYHSDAIPGVSQRRDGKAEDAAHIATADPPTVLELVREVRRLREERDRYREALEEIADAIEWDTDPRSIRHLCDIAEEALEGTDE